MYLRNQGECLLHNRCLTNMGKSVNELINSKIICDTHVILVVDSFYFYLLGVGQE